jgi:hypothetical protein
VIKVGAQILIMVLLLYLSENVPQNFKENILPNFATNPRKIIHAKDNPTVFIIYTTKNGRARLVANA